MDLIKNLDKEWYFLGYSAGINSRKKVNENILNPLKNYGSKQNVSLTDKQKISFILGVNVGRRTIQQGLEVRRSITTQNPKPVSTGDILTIRTIEVEGVRGNYINVPVIITNNTIANKGVKAYIYEMEYDDSYLTLDSVTQSTSFPGTFQVDDSVSGKLRIVCERDNNITDNPLLFTMRFLISSSTPLDLPKLSLKVKGNPGTGNGTEILTSNEGVLSYIVPIEIDSGVIHLDTQIQEKDNSILVPTGETSQLPPSNVSGGGSSYTSYTFSAGGGFVSGYTPLGGIYVSIGVYIDGTLIGYEEIPIDTSGTYQYTGRIPLTSPEFLTGVVTYEMNIITEFEEDSQFAYVFIPAGALFEIVFDTPRELTDELILEKDYMIAVTYIYLNDYAIIELIDVSSGEFDFIITEDFKNIFDYDIIKLLEREDISIIELIKTLIEDSLLQLFNVKDINLVEYIKLENDKVLIVIDGQAIVVDLDLKLIDSIKKFNDNIEFKELFLNKKEILENIKNNSENAILETFNLSGYNIIEYVKTPSELIFILIDGKPVPINIETLENLKKINSNVTFKELTSNKIDSIDNIKTSIDNSTVDKLNTNKNSDSSSVNINDEAIFTIE